MDAGLLRSPRGPIAHPFALPVALLLVAASLLGCGPDVGARSPNIVLIVADDQSYRDFGFMGSAQVKTPRLDALAREGIVFTHAQNTASVCRPALRTLLTGLEPTQLEVIETVMRAQGTRHPSLVSVERVGTLPKRLAERGYASFEGGKFWEGSYAQAGFGEGMTTGEPEPGQKSDPSVIAFSGGAGTRLGRETMTPLFDFIDRQGDTPFFVWFAPMLPHTPHDAPARFEAPYRLEPDLSPATRRYYANITRLDERVGELLDHLDARGLREQTLIVFLSDNGWDQTEDEPGFSPYLGGPRGKLSMHENGFRTPIVLRWPGRIPADARSDALVSTLDLYPTLLELAGVEAEPSIREGRSLVPLLRGQVELSRAMLIGSMSRLRRDDPSPASWRELVAEEIAYFRRDRTWRTIWYPERDRIELYRIAEDPWEREDLAAKHPRLTRRHEADIRAWARRMRRPVAPAPRGAGQP